MRNKILPSILVFILTIAGLSQGDVNRNNKKVNDRTSSFLEITFVANSGFLVSSARKKVLIDALFRDDYPPENILNKLETAQSPFDHVQLILVTHIDSDHVNGVMVRNHLRSNPEAILSAPQEVVLGIRMGDKDFREIKLRVRQSLPEWNSSITQTINGIQMKVLRLYHGGRRRLRTQNLGFLIYLEGKKFFHIGDAEETIDNFEPFEWLAKEEIDVAFIPYWFLASREGIEIINRLIKPRHVILMHIPAGDEERVAFEARKVKIGLPSVTVFKSCMEKKNFTE